MKFKKTYSFAFLSALYLTLLAVFISVVAYFLYDTIGFLATIIGVVFLFVLSFFIVQYRVEHFIYQRVRKIYNDVSLLDNDDLHRQSVTTDMETLSKSLQKFTEGKRIEIQNLIEKDSFRREFLGNVAHELKTPLFTVQGYVLTLIEGAANDKEIREKYLERTNKGVERLVAIVKDLDMISRLESEGLKMNFAPFNILELIDAIYEFPIFVLGDIDRIEQVLINLVVNSIKYGKTGGITSIGIESYSENKFIIKVSDNGEGVKQEHLSRLFERFYRVDQSRSRKQGGSGLGLAIVKHLIEAHNETILLKSTYGEGSEFSFTLKKAT